MTEFFTHIVSNLWTLTNHAGPYAPLAMLVLVGLVALSLSRLGLMIWQKNRVCATNAWPQIIIQGVRADVIQLCLFILPLILVAPILATSYTWSFWQQLTIFWVTACLTLLFFLEAATPGFIAEYDARPNRLFVEYLKYPKEVVPMLWKGFRVHVFAGVIVTVLTVCIIHKLMLPFNTQPATWPNVWLWLSWPIVLLATVFAIRSTTQHRPANPAFFAFTADSMVNSIVINSTWSVFYAIYNLKHEAKSSAIYGKMAFEKVLEIVKNARQNSNQVFSNNLEIPTETYAKPAIKRAKPLNLVIVLQESMGATFVESLGGIAVTPELEKLKTKGWWFEQLYATGTRSVRGIEAVVTGFLPTPAQSTVKLSLSQNNFFSLASLLKTKGYHSQFLYGGEKHFDNMADFFLGNGFDHIVDESDFKDAVFKGSWGASDEDVFNRAHTEILKSHTAKQSFFKLIFTSSNHSPFEYPDGRFELHEQPKATENNAVKYADYAMGQFFKEAEQSAYWQDTLFVIVADHDIRIRGESLVPVKNFHLPALILGADLTHKSITSVASQVDLPTTALSLMGIEARYPMIGRDIAAEMLNEQGRDRAAEALTKQGRAMMQFEDNYAWMEGNAVVVLRPQKAPIFATYNKSLKKLDDIHAEGDAGLAERALAHVLLPATLYREQKYKDSN